MKAVCKKMAWAVLIVPLVGAFVPLSIPRTTTTTTSLVWPHGNHRPAHYNLHDTFKSSSSSSSSRMELALTTESEPDVAEMPPSSSFALTGSKFQRLKDLMWVREALEDLTAAEFASSLDASPDNESQRKRKRAIDFENILNQLNKRLVDLGCVYDDDEFLCDMVTLSANEDLSPILRPGKGMGVMVYSEPQRELLLKRLLRTRLTLIDAMKNHVKSEEGEPFSIPLPELKIPKEDDASALGPKLYVRDDGTVDWDGALQDRAALRNFGTAVWARINGQDPESVTEDSITDGHSVAEPEAKAVTAKIEETEEIRRERALLDVLKKDLAEMESRHTALLNSALSAGQAVANINFATLDSTLRTRIRNSTTSLDKKKEEVSYQSLIYELERIYTYLAGELGNPGAKGYIPLQDRLNVAEFGLLESQIASFSRQLELGESVDADVLAVVLDQVTDFKRRLGIDYYVTGLTYDREAIQRWLNDLLDKTKSGIGFYVKGCQLFWNDIVFCMSLIGRALQGYTLKPREVRNLRRTFKDVITFIPVVIILIIPLSPVGHVMVFGAIQRFFPDFFPSCFTERRQNLLQLYESTEYTAVVINESWKDKIARISKALVFFIATASRKAFASLTGRKDADDESSEDTDR